MTAESVATILIIFGLAIGALALIRKFQQRALVAERRIDELTARLSEESSRSETLSTQIEELSNKFTALADSIEGLRAMRSHSLPIDPTVLQGMPEAEMVSLAESIATLRPLVPYPNWRFDIDWDNPDQAFQMRRQVWQSFHDGNIETPVVIGWHGGTRLQLRLGSDLSRQIYIAGCIDPNEFAFLDRYLEPGMAFFDVGANEGIYAVFAARRLGNGGTVWAFEPSRRECERLRANVQLNESPITRVFPVALGECSGHAELTVAENKHAGQNTLGAFTNPGVAAAEIQIVDVRRLDDVVAGEPPSRIDVIKLDVEGAELRVLQGAISTLKRYRPVLLFEVADDSLVHQGSSRQALLDFLQLNEYSLYVFDRAGVPACAQRGIYGDNMLAVPNDKVLPPIVFQPWPVTFPTCP